jgi:hypothetical protein
LLIELVKGGYDVGTAASSVSSMHHHVDNCRLAASVGFEAALQRIVELLRIGHVPQSGPIISDSEISLAKTPSMP